MTSKSGVDRESISDNRSASVCVCVCVYTRMYACICVYACVTFLLVYVVTEREIINTRMNIW